MFLSDILQTDLLRSDNRQNELANQIGESLEHQKIAKIMFFLNPDI